MVKVLRWPAVAEEQKVIHIPVHPGEQICMVGRAPDQVHDRLAFSIWTTDHLNKETDRLKTAWDRSFVVTVTGEKALEDFDTWRASWQMDGHVFHLFEKIRKDALVHD